MTSYLSAKNEIARWLSNSHIIWKESTDELEGGFFRSYDWKKKTYDYLYLEITGYAASCFLNRYRYTHSTDDLMIAGRAVKFLTRFQKIAEDGSDTGAFPHSIAPHNHDIRSDYFSFDAAMCLQGLMDYYQQTQEREILDRAILAGNWLVNRMQRADGSFVSVVGGIPTEELRKDLIFGDGCVLHAKNAIGLIKLGIATNDERFLQGARKVCDWVLQHQSSTGGFRASTATRQVVAHTHCYATEGLLYAYHHFQEKRYLEAAQKSAHWLAKNQDREGAIKISYGRTWREMGIRRLYEGIWPKRVTDATAQAVRIWLLLYSIDRNPQYIPHCEKAIKFMVNMQIKSTLDLDATGGLMYWPGRADLFAWVAMFAYQAIENFENHLTCCSFEKWIEELF